jgi:arylsulfatase A-like enzyme/HEAT repeat protein
VPEPAPRTSPLISFLAAFELGASTGLWLGGIEVLYVGYTSMPYFDGVGEFLRFAITVLAALLGLGAAVGAVEGALVALLSGRARTPNVRAALAVALAAGPVALLCTQIFRGPRARTIPGHQAYAVAIGLMCCVAVFVAARAVEGTAAWLARREGSPGRARAVLAGAALSGILVYVADQAVLPRLYPFFHRGLELITVALGQIFVGWAACRRSRRGAAGRLLGLFALVVGPLAIGYTVHDRALATVVVERTALEAQLLRPVLRLRPSARPRSTAVAAAAAQLLPPGPHLGAVDVVLITIDALRADRLNARTTPSLAELAATSVVFEEAFAQVPHTSFSVATLLTGKHVYSLSTLGRSAASHQTLAQVLRRERYKTAAFFPPSVFFIDHERLRPLEESAYGFEYVKYEFLPAPQRTDQVIAFLETERPARAFIWVHYIEPHEPYDAHPGHLQEGAHEPPSAEERYDSEVHFVDAEAGRLVAYLRARRPHALVIVAADHGEEFGEHGGRYHGTTLYDEQIRVPLLFASLDQAGLKSRRVTGPVGLVDVAPTVLSLIGVAPSAKMRGRDLSPWMGPVQVSNDLLGPEFAEIDRKKMVVEHGQKLICDLELDACQLFDRASDPKELRNRIADASAADRRQTLDGWMSAQTRYEREDGTPRDAAADALERGRRGDRTAALALSGLLVGAPAAVRREAARLLCLLPADPATGSPLRAAQNGDDPEVRRWATLGLARLSDGPERAQLRAQPPCTGEDVAYLSGVALALKDPTALAGALEQLSDDERALRIALISALGETHAPLALDPLLGALASVRTRVEVVDALTELGDPRAIDPIARWMAADPYVPVRARMARLLGRLGSLSGGDRADRARRAVETLGREERERPVAKEVLTALRALRSPRILLLGSAPFAARAGLLWLEPDGARPVEVRLDGRPLPVGGDASTAEVEVPRAGRLTVTGARYGFFGAGAADAPPDDAATQSR